MYEATQKEREELTTIYGYKPEAIDSLDVESDLVRKGIPIGLMNAIAVITYQDVLQQIRKLNKKWWQFWK